MQDQLVAELVRRNYVASIIPGTGDTDVAIFTPDRTRVIGLVEVKAKMLGTSGNWRNLYEALGQVLYHAQYRNPVPALAICGTPTSYDSDGRLFITGPGAEENALKPLRDLGVSIFFCPNADEGWYGLDAFLERIDDSLSLT